MSVVILTKKIGMRLLQDLRDLWMAIAVIAVYTVFMNLVFHAFCPMVILTGLPCPGCGMTRALFFLITGRPKQAVWMHPMSIPVVCLLLYFLWNRYILGRKAKGMGVLTGITCVILVVVYLWRMYCFFPDRIPYIYKEYNILSKVFPFYEQILHGFKIL